MGEEEVVAPEPGPGRDGSGEQRQQHRHVPQGAGSEPEVEAVAAPGVEAEDDQGGQEAETQRPVHDRVPERQRQEVEAHVLSEHRLRDARRPAVHEEGQRLPLAACPAREDQGHQAGGDQAADARRAAQV